ncbi:MAG: hypothetical protein M0R51_15360 [Clostridia bacterium]|jgi:hypothetical protein|nr:hypothetical protein [Clostridia bacterium]
MEVRKNGLTLRVDKDISFNLNPRENFSNIGTMFCFHRSYRLGDETDIKDTEKFNDWLQENKDNIILKLPLFLYDHSGICISTSDFNDPWDSGKVGHIVCTKENLEKIGLKNLSVGKIKEQLEKEVKEYSDYLEGNKTYYYFSIFDKKHNLIDSCSGYKYENLKDMLHEMSKYDEEYIFLFNALLKKENQNYL